MTTTCLIGVLGDREPASRGASAERCRTTAAAAASNPCASQELARECSAWPGDSYPCAPAARPAQAASSGHRRGSQSVTAVADRSQARSRFVLAAVAWRLDRSARVCPRSSLASPACSARCAPSRLRAVRRAPHLRRVGRRTRPAQGVRRHAIRRRRSPTRRAERGASRRPTCAAAGERFNAPIARYRAYARRQATMLAAGVRALHAASCAPTTAPARRAAGTRLRPLHADRRRLRRARPARRRDRRVRGALPATIERGPVGSSAAPASLAADRASAAARRRAAAPRPRTRADRPARPTRPARTRSSRTPSATCSAAPTPGAAPACGRPPTASPATRVGASARSRRCSPGAATRSTPVALPAAPARRDARGASAAPTAATGRRWRS